jgi:hypothetical protein
MTEGKKSYQCPKCGEVGTLWEAVTVPGWRSIDQHLDPTGDRDIDWYDAERDSWASPEMGCGECGWEGTRSELSAIGIDGKPLPVIHPNQLAIEET